MHYNLPQHSYQELRDGLVQLFIDQSVWEFNALLEATGRALNQSSPGIGGQLHPYDAALAQEGVWDLFRQGVVTLGKDPSNPTWPWLRISRFGKGALQAQNPLRFHDPSGFLKILRAEVPDISQQAVMYLEEALGPFYADCLLASVVMLGIAAEAEFLRLVDQASKSSSHGSTFSPINKLPFIRQKITKFQDLLNPMIKQLPRFVNEDLDTNLNTIQSVLRISRNDFGHPSGETHPTREQVYVFIQLFVPYARQLMRLRKELE